MGKSILFVLTSNDKLGDTGKKTGSWLEEFAAPYELLTEAGHSVTFCTPSGEAAPVDEGSKAENFLTKLTAVWDEDEEGQKKFNSPKKLSDVSVSDYDAVFYPGGHGPVWDLADDKTSIALIEAFAQADKVVASVCHGPVVFVNTSVIQGKNVTGFSNTEEEAVGLTKVMPYLLEDKLKANGGNYSKGDDWGSHVVVDGKLITGQNPGSSEEVAKAIMKLL
ncbi:ThiJ/PfpI family protein [Sphaeroforma arctica JP610]|uniref:ThiJ/PfpI family protein n=1 Tax=Sphaeroforma arctica JP610 TaxID=667725 RepID=A0A0L0FVC2_9EUKA|nr:ThiJ/PfpI family protein [Sphaeroforma arctica JP610]KNC80564.1 ThiJ/PfpI family protein [Sphaeroforma arctica JP610]|eukprot:XP_014154466.1 ThiJ/PfpI family protein [Sphaeroforma arctica JP610]